MQSMVWLLFALIASVLCRENALPPQTFMVKMRDGVLLHTVVILNSTSPLPVVMIRTPYGTSTCTSFQDAYVKLGYNTVAQDFRGRYESQGSFDFFNHSAPDAYDTMEWIVGQKWSNQQVFTTGISADGIACYLQYEENDWLKGQLVVFGTSFMYKTTYQGGAYREALTFGWLTAIGEESMVPMVLSHEAYGSFWSPTNDEPYWQDIRWPAVHQTGWYDIFLQQQLDAYTAYSTLSSSPYKSYNSLVIGPGGHCSRGGQVPWPYGKDDFTIAGAIANKLFYALQDPTKRPFTSVVNYYVLGPALTDGEIGNYWTHASSYPPTANNTEFYLNADNTLSVDPPSTSDPTTFLYDPENPVPTYGGNNLVLPQCGPWDQIQLENRSDVISFTSPVFKAPTAITGRVFATLYVASNATDTDFTVKITDVYPNGTSMLIQDGVLTMKWRYNNTTPVFINPGEVYEIEVDLWSTSYIFNIGHALRVSVSSSNCPRFYANLNNGQPLSNPGIPVVAQNTIYHDSAHPSRVTIPFVTIPEPYKPDFY